MPVMMDGCWNNRGAARPRGFPNQGPVLCFWGVNDKFCPMSGATAIAESCPDARVVLLSRCGHWVMVEHAEFFNRQCIDFLREG